MVTYLAAINKHFFITYRNLFSVLISVEIRHFLFHVSLLIQFGMAATLK